MGPTKLPAVCIVGRPNVGKSTLFNRIIGKDKAVVYQASGTTRDRIEFLCKKDDITFRLIDTGGYLKATPDEITFLVKKQIQNAIAESDLLLFVCDVKSGIIPQDEEILPILRKSEKKILLIVNKVDNEKLKEEIYDFYQLGLGRPYPVSAIHNLGMKDLTDDILKTISLSGKKEHEDTLYKIAITGRPNVGKSLFLNTLLSEERVIVDDIPGTTRDSIDTYFKKDKDLFLLIDTAGMRHKRKVRDAIDVYSMSRSREAIRRSNISFLLIDGYEGVRNDDVRIFNFIIKSGKCCVLVVNKWDLVKGIQMADYKKAILRKTPNMTHYPIIFASAKTGRNILSCIDMVRHIVANSDQKIKTSSLNKLLVKAKRLPGGGRKRPKLYYMVQTSTRPPEFLIFVNDVKLISEEYANFIEGMMRKEYFFYGTPIKIQYRRKR